MTRFSNMAEVKGKKRICQTSIGDFNVEQINGSPFYNRYVEFLRVFKKHILKYDPEVLFAQPEENANKGAIDWYIPNTSSYAITLDALKTSSPSEYQRYLSIKDDVLQYLYALNSEIGNPQEQVYFNCALKFLDSEYLETVTYCHDDTVSFAVWGMKMRKGRDINTVITDDVGDHRVHSVTYSIKGKGHFDGKSEIIRKHGHTLHGVKDIPTVVPEPHYSFIEWIPFAPQGKTVENDMTFTAVCERTDEYQIVFLSSEGGEIEGASTLLKKPGEELLESDVPNVVANDGYRFTGWEPAIAFGVPVNEDNSFTARFEKYEVRTPIEEPIEYNVRFDAGKNGTLCGSSYAKVLEGDILKEQQIPSVVPSYGYQFIGWDKNVKKPINGDVVFTALYSAEKIPWYLRFWWWLKGLFRGLWSWLAGLFIGLWSWLAGLFGGLWAWLVGLFGGRGCLSWLLGLLMFLLLMWLFSHFLGGCNSCVGWNGYNGLTPVNGVLPADTIVGTDGRIRDANGYVKPITGSEGRLPEGSGVAAPVLGEGGSMPPVVEQPGVPKIFGDRLFLFMENENDDIESLAQDFKSTYPSDNYKIIGFDREVKLLVIQVPEAEKDEIRQTINNKIPNHKFIVFDEEIYELHGHVNLSSENPGWHLNAINLKEGWKVTKGSSDIKVAVVDDGIDASHSMFAGRIVDAYNVFSKNNHLSVGQGHGTHTAGLAVGSDDYFAKGASGVAPNCQLMPIQVFDNGLCPLSALIAGVMYAIHHDADVVNISIGPSFNGLNQLPVEAQNEIAHKQFKNVEYLWARVCNIAAKKNCILVFAAGNDDILSSIPPENRNSSAIVVSAVDTNKYPTVFTNYGPCSDISAPGKDIFSSFPTNAFQSFDGTSMAAPIVSGTIALMKSLKKDMTVEQARNALYKSGADVYGFIPPMVLVDAALDCVKRSDFSKPSVREMPPVPNGQGDDSAANKIIDNVSIPEEDVTPILSSPTDNTDYDEIRKQIKKYEKKIEELKQKLPENKNK